MILIDFTTDGIQPTISNVSTESTHATVSWQLSEPIAGVMKYEILVSSDSHQCTHNASKWSRSYTVSNLSPETVYLFQVRAVTSSDENGTCIWSEPKVGITLPISTFV